MPSQNVYDWQEFFDGYSTLPRSQRGLDAAPEWPVLRAMLPDSLSNLSIVDLGCGFGYASRFFAEQGAESVFATDVSEKMLERAKELSETAKNGSKVDFQKADLETLELPSTSFDLVYSSLVLHYIEDLPRLLKTIHDSLRTNGTFVFSAEHPIYTAPSHMAFRTDETTGERIWPLNNYSNEGPRLRTWFVDGVKKQHRTLGTLLNMLIDAGFRIAKVVEFAPTMEQIEREPGLEEEMDRPMFVLVACDKN